MERASVEPITDYRTPNTESRTLKYENPYISPKQKSEQHMSQRLDQLKSFLAENPDDPFLLFAVAKEYEKQEIPEKALEFYAKVIEADPNYVGVYYHLGKWHERAGAFDQAIEVYKKGQKVAKEQGDKHALGEISAALLAIEE